MSEALEYFKKVYKDVPAWVQIMHDYNPKMLEYYTNIRSEAFKSDVLTDIEKDELIATFNAGRLYDRSMVYHTQAALNKGSKLEDLVEYFLISYVYAGEGALELSLQAIAQYLQDKDNKEFELKDSYSNVKEIVEQIKVMTVGYDQSFIEKVFENINNEDQLEETIMSEGSVSLKRKKLALVGMYITELDGQGATESIAQAREAGVTEEEFADLGYVIILTAGIPSWFELSDHLEPK